MVDQLENSGVESLIQLDEPRLRWSQWQTQVLSRWSIEPRPKVEPVAVRSGATVADLQRQERTLRQEICPAASLLQVVSEQMAETQTALGRLVPEALASGATQTGTANCCGTAGTSSRTHPHGDANEFCWGFPRSSDSGAGL